MALNESAVVTGPEVGSRTVLGSAAVAGLRVIAMRRASGPTKVLVGVRAEPCPHCRTGSRTISTWCTLAGTTERLSWCGHCFSAQSVRAGLSEEERGEFARACRAIASQADVLVFDCARHAVEYLMRLWEEP